MHRRCDTPVLRPKVCFGHGGTALAGFDWGLYCRGEPEAAGGWLAGPTTAVGLEEELHGKLALGDGADAASSLLPRPGIVLDWSRMGLDASDVTLASGAMAASPLLCTGCTELQLSFSRIGDAGCTALASALGALGALEVLELQDCGLGDAAACALAEALTATAGGVPSAGERSVLRRLALGSNPIADAGCAALAAALLDSPRLLRRSGAAGAAAADAAGDTTAAAAAVAAAAATAAAAAPARSLAILQLGDTSIGDVGAAAIACALDAGAMPCSSMATLAGLAGWGWG